MTTKPLQPRHYHLIKSFHEKGRSVFNIAAALGLPEPQVQTVIDKLKNKQDDGDA
jgi:hypothetical protein